MDKKGLRILTYVIMVYMLLAFAWWAMLLFSKNREVFEAKALLYSLTTQNTDQYSNQGKHLDAKTYQQLVATYQRQKWMIIGEGMVFLITLGAGIWFINASYHREIKVNEQRRNFLLSITHELKSPIASIQLVLETLLKRELSREKAVEFLKAALEENERLQRLVDNLLFSAKLESTYQPDLEELDLAKIANEVMERFRVQNPQALLKVEVKGTLPLLLADRAGMTSVFSNLVENAIKYGPDQPNVEITLEMADDDHLQILVADNGQGVPPAERKNIFRKFYRIGNEQTRKTKGTGLGLFIVEQVVKAHGGSIGVEANHPSGTIFKITLPIDHRN